MKTLTFFGEPELKQAVRARVAEHQRLDQIIQGDYWDGERGCFIGCSLHSPHHQAFETHLGLPQWFAHLGERIFEGIAMSECRTFPLEVYDAIPVGADMGPVRWKFLVWVLERVREYNPGAVDPVLEMMRRQAVEPFDSGWLEAANAAAAASKAAASAAASKASNAAWAASAANSAAAKAAYAASYAHAAAAAAAANASNADDAYAVRDEFYRDARVELIRLLKDLKPEPSFTPHLPTVDPVFTSYYERVRQEAGI